MKSITVSDYRVELFNEIVNLHLTDPPKGYFVQEVQFRPVMGSATVHYTAMIIYGEIPTS